MRTLLLSCGRLFSKEAKLADLLKHLVQAISVRSDIPIAFNVRGDVLLPAEVQIALYRITQEALNNVIKHANPSQASVTLSVEPAKANLIVSDDGCGFDLSNVSSEHFGLSIMKERAASINATIKLISKPGLGTQIVVEWKEFTQKDIL
jgi:signal transduction histidine kinase